MIPGAAGAPAACYDPARPVRKAIPALLPWTVFALLTAASWQRWIEPYVDSGRELMVPWRVAGGETLYRDIHFHHGPLAPYAGAALDLAGGRSLPARTAFAFAIALVALEGLRRIASRALSPPRASLAVALAIAVAVFLRPGGWTFPFSFDTAIAVAALTWVAWGCDAKTRAGTAAVALGLWLAWISRVELGLAGAAAALWALRGDRARLAIGVLAPAGAAAVVYALVSAGVPMETLVRDGWLAVLRPPQAFQNVYRTFAGLDAPALRLMELALAAFLLLLVICVIVLGAALSGHGRTAAGRAAPPILAVALLAGAALVLLFPPSSLAQAASAAPPLIRTLPAAVLGIAVLRAVRAAGSRIADPAPGIGDATILLGAFFAARLLLAAGYVGPYDSFFLPLPLVIAAAAAWRLAEASHRSVGPAVPRLVTASLALFLVVRTVDQIRTFRSPSWSPVNTPSGALFLREPVAGATRAVLSDLESRVPRGGRVTGFPETGFFNYALGFSSAERYEQFFPGHQDPAAERLVIEDLARRPPAAVLVANVLAIGEHAPAFGRDYLPALAAFVRERFPVAAAYGPGAGPDPSVGDPQFFVAVRVPR